MSMYNMIFGKNTRASLFLAVLGLKEHDVPRFRDVSVTSNDGKPVIAIYTRMGGGNRGHWDGYDGDGGSECSCPGCRARWHLAKVPGYLYDEDDDFDSTYATYYFAVPAQFANDVGGLDDIFANGLRKEFGEHLLKTIRREPTEADKQQAEYDAEAAQLAKTNHFMANGHTFVPRDDWAMQTALKLAEANGGELRSAWGILPININVTKNKVRWPGMKSAEATFLDRAEVQYDLGWSIDETYWAHCKEVFGAAFPITMEKIGADVEKYLAKAKR